MTRAQAHEILNLWRAGGQIYPAETITRALCATGDIDGHTT